ncbi:MAG TPA: amidohydrolase family protein [Acidimicrobiia bacterium]|nr:amidohydrolase family protein [Acidimicrobiia bacterium]
MRVIVTDLSGSTVERGTEGGCWADPSGDEVLDLSHLVALPGLADGHAHLAHDDMANLVPGEPEGIARRAFAAVESGVFLVFDKGSCDTSVLTLANVPPTERPHFEAAGRMIAAEAGYFPGFAVEVDEAGLMEAVRSASADSAGWVKIVGDWPRKGLGPVLNFGEDVLAAAVGVAHAAGVRVAIHTMAPDMASAAVRAGVDSIEHGLFLDDDDVRALGARSGMWVPTVLRMEAVVAQFGPERTAGRIVAEGLDRVRSLLPGAQEAGVNVLAGTDLCVPSARVAAEAIRLVDYGLTADQAVRAISSDAWAVARLPTDFRFGAAADLVAFARDPREDIHALDAPVAVIRSGRLLRDPR